MGGIFSTAARDERTTKELALQALGGKTEMPSEWANADEFATLDEVTAALRRASVESVSLIVGFDFTQSNKTSGRRTFGGQNLHHIGSTTTPYETVADIVNRVIAPMDDDKLVPVFSFGDAESRHTSVKLLGECLAGDGSLRELYRKAAPRIDMSGPTSFAPAIEYAVEQVKKSNQYHVLLLVTDGIVPEVQNCLQATRKAVVEASNHPLSIVIVGVGDGPFDEMNHLDDDLPERRFDNLQFVLWEPIADAIRDGVKPTIAENAFAIAALQEIPAQFRAITALKLIPSEPDERPAKRARTEPAAIATAAPATELAATCIIDIA